MSLLKWLDQKVVRPIGQALNPIGKIGKQAEKAGMAEARRVAEEAGRKELERLARKQGGRR